MTRILTAKTASTGADFYELTLYDAFGGGRQTWLGASLDLKGFADLVERRAANVDFVCVDEHGVGIALVDELQQRGIGTLRTHRMRPPEIWPRGLVGSVGAQWPSVRSGTTKLADLPDEGPWKLTTFQGRVLCASESSGLLFEIVDGNMVRLEAAHG